MQKLDLSLYTCTVYSIVLCAIMQPFPSLSQLNPIAGAAEIKPIFESPGIYRRESIVKESSRLTYGTNTIQMVHINMVHSMMYGTY